MKKIPLPTKSDSIIQFTSSDLNKKVNVGDKVATFNMLNSVAFSPKFDKVIHFEYPETIIKTLGNEKLSWFMINNEKIRQLELPTLLPVFSPDGERISYVSHTYPATEKDGKIMVGIQQDIVQVDDNTYGPYENVIGNAVFSPDSKRFAFIAKKEHKSAQFGGSLTSLVTVTQYGVEKKTQHLKTIVVIDGVEQQDYIEIHNLPIFSPDSKRIAYPAEKGDINPTPPSLKDGEPTQAVNQMWKTDPYINRRKVYVIDGIESGEFDGLSTFAFSPDSQHYAFIGRRGTTYFVVHDGVESEPYFSCGSLSFNPVTQDLSYSIRLDEKKTVLYYRGNHLDKNFYLIGTQGAKFSNDGQRIGYAGNDFRNKWKMVVDDEESEWYDGIGGLDPTFSPDGKRIAYVIVKNGKQYINIDGILEGPYEGFMASLEFSPDSSRYAYAVKEGDYFITVVDGKKSDGYSLTFKKVFFSEDSKHVAFVVKKTRGSESNFCVLVDSMEGPLFTQIFDNGKNTIKFTQNDSILYYAMTKKGENLSINLVETSYNIPEKFCTKCGNRIPDLANKFCSKCGNKLI